MMFLNILILINKARSNDTMEGVRIQASRNDFYLSLDRLKNLGVPISALVGLKQH